jgi:hypothetical protein
MASRHLRYLPRLCLFREHRQSPAPGMQTGSNKRADRPKSVRPASLYLAAQAFIYGSSRRLLMHEYVQKLTSTTFPRRARRMKGAELSHAAAPSKSGIRPSSRVPDAIATRQSSGAAIATVALCTNLRRLLIPGSSMLCFLHAIRRFGCDHVVLYVDVAASC